MRNSVDVTSLELFFAVLREGTFTKAAASAGVPTSTVSRAIDRLEDVLQMPLFFRSTRSVKPTDRAIELERRLRPHLDALEAALESAKAMADEPSGTVRITAANDVGAALLAEPVARFLSLYPRVSVEVLLTNRVLDLVRDRIDLAVRPGPLRGQGLRVKRLRPLPMGVVASPSFVARHGTPRDPDDLPAERIVTFTCAKSFRQIVFHKGSKEVTLRIEPGLLRTDDFGFVRRFVLVGGGVGIVPMFLVEDDLRSGSLVRLLEGWEAPAETLYVVHAMARRLSREAELLRATVVDALRAV